MSNNRRCRQLRRRTFLQVGGLGALGLGLPELFWGRQQAQAAGASDGTAKSCIILYATGGPSQLETFDPKPNAIKEYRGEFDPIPTSVPGVHICELLPQMARLAHEYCIIRSMFHESAVHGVGSTYNLTGAPGQSRMSRTDAPSIGGALRQLRGDRNGLPAAVQLPAPIGDENSHDWGGQHAGFLGQKYDPLPLIDPDWTPGTLPSVYSPRKEVGPRRRGQRAELLHRLEGGRLDFEWEPVEAFARFREQALNVLTSNQTWRAFSIEEEKPSTLERYGDNRFGRSCLVARRLIEAGVALVTVPWMYLHSTRNFDTHYNNFRVMRDLLMPPVDRAFSALLEDLQERGMLGETLVVWTGEFGRSPRINDNAGRDHWRSVYSTVLAGGGVRGGQVHGSSDKDAGEVATQPVHARDFVATIYHALGYGPNTVVQDQLGRPQHLVTGRAVRSIF